MMLKILLVIGVIGIVYFMFIKKKPLQKPKENPKNEKKDKLQSNDMVECSTCGIYSELAETVISSNKYYCSDECVGKA